MFRLPSKWVFVYFEDGKAENVANTDSLTIAEAEKYKEMWEKATGKKVVRVDLQNRKGAVVKGYKWI